MKCREFWVKADGRLVCNVPRYSGSVVGTVEDPPKGLSASQKRQISEWKRVREIARGIADYFHVASLEDGLVLVWASFTAPMGADDILDRIRVNLEEIRRPLDKGGNLYPGQPVGPASEGLPISDSGSR